MPPAFLNVHCDTPAPEERASCEPVVEAMVSGQKVVVVVPMPTKPKLVTMRFVAVDEPITNCGTFAARLFPLIESRPQGEVVPTPTLPL